MINFDPSKYVSPEKPGEFDGLDPDTVEFIRKARKVKAEMRFYQAQLVEIQNELESPGRSYTAAQLETRINALRDERTVLLYEIARRQPGYGLAIYWAHHMLFLPIPKCTVRYYKRDPNKKGRSGCFTFGTPNGVVYRFWVDLTGGPKLSSLTEWAGGW